MSAFDENSARSKLTSSKKSPDRHGMREDERKDCRKLENQENQERVHDDFVSTSGIAAPGSLSQAVPSHRKRGYTGLRR